MKSNDISSKNQNVNGVPHPYAGTPFFVLSMIDVEQNIGFILL